MGIFFHLPESHISISGFQDSLISTFNLEWFGSLSGLYMFTFVHSLYRHVITKSIWKFENYLFMSKKFSWSYGFDHPQYHA